MGLGRGGGEAARAVENVLARTGDAGGDVGERKTSSRLGRFASRRSRVPNSLTWQFLQ